MGDVKQLLHSKSSNNLRNANEEEYPVDCPYVKISLHSKSADNVEDVIEEWNPFDCPDFQKHSFEHTNTGQKLSEHLFDDIPFDELREDALTRDTDMQPSIEKREKDGEEFHVPFPWKESPEEACLEDRCPSETCTETQEDLTEKVQSTKILRDLKSLRRKMRKEKNLKTKELAFEEETPQHSLLTNVELSSFAMDSLGDKSLRKIPIPWSKSKSRSGFSQTASETLELYKDDTDENSIATFLTHPSANCDSSVESRNMNKNFWLYDPEREAAHQNKSSVPGVMHTVFFDSC